MRARAGGTSDTDSLDDEDQKPSRPRAAKVNQGLVVLVFILSGVVLLLLLGPSHEIHHSVPAVPAGDAGRFDFDASKFHQPHSGHIVSPFADEAPLARGRGRGGRGAARGAAPEAFGAVGRGRGRAWSAQREFKYAPEPRKPEPPVPAQQSGAAAAAATATAAAPHGDWSDEDLYTTELKRVEPDVLRLVGPPREDLTSKATCLSFRRDYCPPLNLTAYGVNQREQNEVFRRYNKYVRNERDVPPSTRFCGRRVRRLNPCWSEGGSTYCLPRFFILGEMKCGTTTLYHLLTKNKQVVPPLTKEPRFLQQGRFQQTSLSRYAREFEAAAAQPDGVTFDASPVYLHRPPRGSGSTDGCRRRR